MQDLALFLLLGVFPIVLVGCVTFYKVNKLRLEQPRTPIAPLPPRVEERLALLEHRLLTLQDLVIGGSYEVGRRREDASRAPTAANPVTAQPATASATSADHVSHAALTQNVDRSLAERPSRGSETTRASF